jgi:hypothetical protein
MDSLQTKLFLADTSLIRLGQSKITTAPRVAFLALLIIGFSFPNKVGAVSTPAINVSLSNTTSTSTTEFIRGSDGLNSAITIPYAPGVSYDAADQIDSGTVWNSVICPNNPSDPGQTLRDANIPLVDSNGNAGSYNLFAAVQNSNFQLLNANPQPFMATGAGTDGLAANPSQLMSQGWQDPSTTEEILFILAGLPIDQPCNVYLYGSGPTLGSGATFVVNGVSTTSTEPSLGAIYRSVFDSTGSNATPENGLSWSETVSTNSGNNGSVVIEVQADASTGIAGSVNGFQVQTLVPEPASTGLLIIGATLTMRRKNKSVSV